MRENSGGITSGSISTCFNDNISETADANVTRNTLQKLEIYLYA